MTLYQPFKNREGRRQFKKNGFRLCLFIGFCLLVSLCWVMLSDSGSPPVSSPILEKVNRISSSSSDFSLLPGGGSKQSEIIHTKGELENADEGFRKVNGVLEKGDTLYNFLLRKEVKKSTISSIIRELEPIVPFSTAMPGNTFALTLDVQENLHHFEYSTGPMETYIVERDPNGKLDGFKKEILLQKYWAVLSGEVNNSLCNAITAISNDSTLAGKFADIFAWKIDFHNEPRKGDKFRLVVEKYFSEDTFIKYGKILAVEYNGYCGLHQAIFFENGKGESDYYDLNGVSVRRAFLRAPLRFTRISSGYSYHRRHPILGYVRPHLGIDYAAPSGTPVWAVADGTVITAKYMGQNGNQVIIKHMNGYKTYYNHLSRYGKGIKKDVKVRQKQVIGYVGTTGLSTGPHLDYRVKHHRKFVNPLKANFPVGQKLDPTDKKLFHQIAYNFLHFMYDNQKEKWICKVLYEDQKSIIE